MAGVLLPSIVLASLLGALAWGAPGDRDEVWMARLWLTRHPPTTVTRAELVESLQRLWVNPPADFTGRWTTYHVNGQKSHAIDYREGKYDGEWIGFHPNGRPNVIQHY